MNYFSKIKMPIGQIVLQSDGEYLTGLWLDEKKYIPSKKENLKIFKDVEKWLKTYFDGKEPKFKIPLKLQGTFFQTLVWKELLKIGYSKSISYGEIAKNVAKTLGKEKMSAQAVGGAVGSNPVSIIVPCHRVLGKDKSLTGYAGGLKRKEFLLNLEKIDFIK